jgi:hypothetical protein
VGRSRARLRLGHYPNFHACSEMSPTIATALTIRETSFVIVLASLDRGYSAPYGRSVVSKNRGSLGEGAPCSR